MFKTMSKVARKGRHPGTVDNWLDSLGLYRKNVAFDETCLFRAVSEQLFNCQVYHERVRRDCITYAREHFEEFTDFISSKANWNEHINQLEKHMVVCGKIELNLISKKYQRDIILFHAARQQVYDATKNNYPESITLCLMDEDHFDVVYKKEHIVTAGFCQSMVYKILYENVFEIPNVDEIVNNMLYEKIPLSNNEFLDNDVLNNNEIDNNSTKDCEDMKPDMNNQIAPFPFKVAKALDPNIYRNIEYDAWGEVRREMRLGDWYYGDDKLILGTKCILTDVRTNDKLDCYIQQILKDQNKCVVYVTSLAEKKIVDYSDLAPESDAKAWPLPYRFSKNLAITSLPQLPHIEKIHKVKKRSKDKKRTKSESNLSICSTAAVNSEPADNVKAYVGIPLQMSPTRPPPPISPPLEVSTETQTDPIMPVHDVPTPSEDTRSNLQWEQWPPYVAPSDPFVWPTQGTPQYNYDLKPMVASAPVTPNIVPYHDPNYPFYYNCHVEQYPMSMYNQYSPPPVELQVHQKIEENKVPEMPQVNIEMHNPKDVGCEQGVGGGRMMVHRHERPKLLTHLAPPSPGVEMYSPAVMPMAPGTPIMYTSVPHPQEMQPEMMLPTPPVLYTPPVEYIFSPVPQQFVYPPTPPSAWYPPTSPTGWYPPHVNSQGFLFHPPRSN